MSIIDYTKAVPTAGNGGYIVITWSALVSGDTGQPLSLAQFADRTIQIGGTFDGSTVIIEGSLDGTNYHTLTDPQGNALSFTLAGLEAVSELVSSLRPRVSGGSSPSVNVTLLMKV